jgi:hypothetical protein
MVKTLFFALAFAFAWAPSIRPASAQPGDESARMQARRLFEEGVALAKSERWAEALSSFRQSRELVPRPSTSYNIANAYYRLDRPVEGLAELDAYNAMPEVRGDVDARERGMRLRALLEASVAEARLAITPIDAEVFVDGRHTVGSAGQWLIRLNPGPHSLRVRHEDYRPTIKEIRVERGSRQAYTIALRPLAPPAPAALDMAPSSVADEPTPASQDDRKRFVKRPGFWAVIGAVAAVGIGAGVAIALTRGDDGPQCGTTGTCATTQGLTLTSF